MLKFAVLGYGVVGSGVVELFYKNKSKIEKKAGRPMDVKYILDIREFPDSPYKNKFVKTIDEIINDNEIKAVAECMGGVEPAYTFSKKCLERGISVSTSNKETSFWQSQEQITAIISLKQALAALFRL